MLQDHGYGTSALRGVPVYIPAYAGTKLYCFATEEHGCEQLGQGCYLTAQQSRLKSATNDSLVQWSQIITAETLNEKILDTTELFNFIRMIPHATFQWTKTSFRGIF